MKINSEKLNELRKDPFMRFLCAIGDVDLDKLIDEKQKELAEQAKPKEEPKNIEDPKLKELLARLAKQTQEAREATNIMKQDIAHNTIDKKQYEAPKCKEVSDFIMTKEQFKGFCTDYSELLNIVHKLEYVYGISFENPTTTKTLSELIRNIIWNFVRIIFGDENSDDIADFLYGNSNFDSPESLYDELT